MNTNHDCSTELRQADLAATPARIASLQLFESHTSPFDAQHLIDHLQKDLGIDRVTVFRILNTFVEKGLITKLEFGEGKARYELAKEDHHHFVCSQCGNIIDLGKDTIMHSYIEKMEKQYEVSVQKHSLELFGLCQKCRKESN